MSQYFAKYLPVEGEIKEFDKVLNRDSGFIDTFGYDYRAIMTLEEMSEKLQKVKLFLCSRDIQVGDKIWDSMDSFYLIIGNQTAIDIYHKRDCNHWTKVIGEISPEATWIKEGHQFKLTDFTPLVQAYLNDPTIKPSLPRYIQIKCPTCKTFH